MSVLNIGITGLRAAQAGLLTTSHNIANASTEGYSRQVNTQSTATANYAGYGFVGQGTNLSAVRRVYSEYLATQILDAESNVGQLDTYWMQASQIDNLLADENAGLSPALSDFFKATQQVAADPASVPSRQSMIASGQALVARFQALDQRLSEIRQGVNTQLINEMTTINAYASEIADINDRIVQATAMAQGQPPNDLLDQRDQLIRDINKEIRVTVVAETNGGVNLFIGNGQPLVIGTQSYGFTADTLSADDPEQVKIVMTAPNGVKVDIPERLLDGGQLGGLLSFRNETLNVTQNALGKIAIGLASTFNAQHQQGLDLDGQFGTNFFSVPEPTVLANGTNTSSVDLSVKIIHSDYRLDFGAGTVTRLSDGTSTAIGGFPLTVDGVTIDLESGTVGGADVFIIKPGNPTNQRVFAQSDNSGDAILDSTGSGLQSLPIVSSDYRLSVGTGSLQLLRMSDNKTWTAADMTGLQALLADDPQGFVIDWQGGVPANPGDSYLIEPTRSGAKNLSVALFDPLKLATAFPFRTSSTLSNQGSGKIDTGSVLAVDPSGVPLSSTVTITYDEASSSLILTGGISTTIPNFISGQPNEIMVNGLKFTISGVPADGDTFTLEPNRNGVSDNRNATALGSLQTLALFGNGSGTYQSTYGQIVSFVGNKTREVEVTGMAQQTLVDQAEATRDGLSGVNIDEEGSNLLRYQQAYQAAAKVMEIAGNMFDELLSLGR